MPREFSGHPATEVSTMKRFLRAPVLAAVAVLVAASAASAVTSTSTATPSNASAPTISGDVAVGSTVTANPGTWRGSAPITFQYQWRICGGRRGRSPANAGAARQDGPSPGPAPGLYP